MQSISLCFHITPNCWINSIITGNFRRHGSCDVSVMKISKFDLESRHHIGFYSHHQLNVLWIANNVHGDAYEESCKPRKPETNEKTLQSIIYKCTCYAVWLWADHRNGNVHDDVIKWKHFPRYWSFVRWIHRSPVNSPHRGQGRGALMFFNCVFYPVLFLYSITMKNVFLFPCGCILSCFHGLSFCSVLVSDDEIKKINHLMFSLIWAWINGWVSNREAGDLIHHRAHYDVTVMLMNLFLDWQNLAL